ncbi:MAG: TIGR04282 family arsenosugar biosynthesis glycosyltransferase [Acidobacteriota bacterium]
MRDCILLFMKNPRPGTVKTRLARFIGAEAACEIYRCSILDLLRTLRSVPARLRVCFTPANAGRQVEQLVGRDTVCQPQRGRDLGKRMESAFLDAFNEDGHDRAVLVGSDLPDLPSSILEDALRSLRNHDSVIGPSEDGGYYLIGFRRRSFTGSVFSGIRWGGPRVFEDTARILLTEHLRTHRLTLWHDMDTMADLGEYIRRNRDTPHRLSKTYVTAATCLDSLTNLDRNERWKTRRYRV